METPEPFEDLSEGLPEDLANILGRYNDAPIISPETEFELFKSIQQGDTQARQRLFESSMRLVIAIAKTYRHKGLAERIRRGASGLNKAIEKFDPEKGFRFSTYATYWIRQSISELQAE